MASLFRYTSTYITIPEKQEQCQIYRVAKTTAGSAQDSSPFMDQKNVPYTKLMLGEDYTSEEFVTQFGHGSTFPRVLLEGELIGGMKETVKYLVENKHV